MGSRGIVNALRFQLLDSGSGRRADELISRGEFPAADPQLIQHLPQGGEPQSPAAVIVLAFDWEIDPAAMLRRLKIQARKRTFAARLLTQEQIDAACKQDSMVDAVRSQFPAEQVMFCRAVKPLPQAAEVTVSIGAKSGWAARSGTNPPVSSFAFLTYPPLRITSIRTQSDEDDVAFGRCNFTNMLDVESFDSDAVKITPELASPSVGIYAKNITVSGRMKPGKRYRITIPATLHDCFGQRLGKAITKTFKAPRQYPWVTLDGVYGKGFTICDPQGSPAAFFRSVNVKAVEVCIYGVTYADWNAFCESYTFTPPGELIAKKVIHLASPPDRVVTTRRDLGDVISEAGGSAIVQWRVVDERQRKRMGGGSEGVVWVEATQIGVNAQSGFISTCILATDLQTGHALQGAEVEILSDKETLSAPTDEKGLACLPLSDYFSRSILVRHEGKLAFLPDFRPYIEIEDRFDPYRIEFDFTWRVPERNSGNRYFFLSDRSIYRPGDTARIKGWLRIPAATWGSLLSLPDPQTLVTWRLTSSDDKEIAKGETRVSVWGSFDLEIAIPETTRNGRAKLFINNQEFYLWIATHRRNEFDVTASRVSMKPFILGHPPLLLAVNARTSQGEAVSLTPLQWTVVTEVTSYDPPGHADFLFGWSDVPWNDLTNNRKRYGSFRRAPWDDPYKKIGTFKGHSDEEGRHLLQVHFAAQDVDRPYQIRAQATVNVLTEKKAADGILMIAHPSVYCVGLKTSTLCFERGEAVVIGTIVCDVEGAPVESASLSFKAVHRKWSFEKSDWHGDSDDTIEWTSLWANQTENETQFVPTAGGMWIITATARDARGRPHRSRLFVWVVDEKGPRPASAHGPRGVVTLVPDRPEYRIGEVAKIEVVAHFPDGEGLLTLFHRRTVRVERFTMIGDSHTLLVPIEDGFLPEIEAHVELCGVETRSVDAEPDDRFPRPAWAAGSVPLRVPPVERQLQVTLLPDPASMASGELRIITVRVTGADGQPVPDAEVALAVVEDAAAHKPFEDPLTAFYPRSAKMPEVLRLHDDIGSRRAVFPSHELTIMSYDPPLSPFLNSNWGDGIQQSSIAAEHIDGAAAFNEITGPDGMVRIPISLQGNAALYRLFAVAVSGTGDVGHAESRITGAD